MSGGCRSGRSGDGSRLLVGSWWGQLKGSKEDAEKGEKYLCEACDLGSIFYFLSCPDFLWTGVIPLP